MGYSPWSCKESDTWEQLSHPERVLSTGRRSKHSHGLLRVTLMAALELQMSLISILQTKMLTSCHT